MEADRLESTEAVFEAHRGLLFGIAYRMLGSAMEAEDMVQEAYLRFRKVDPAQVDSPRAYLTTIITRLCLDELKSARAQRESYYGEWLPEPVPGDGLPVLGAPADSPAEVLRQRESIATAFLVLLESLTPLQRAVFLLREVFDYSYAEIAGMVGESEANCRQHYRRAKQYVVERRPRFEPREAEQERLVAGFLQAVSTGDVGGLAASLAQDVLLVPDGGGRVAAAPRPLLGREQVLRLLGGLHRLGPPGVRARVAPVNGAPALVFRDAEKVFSVMTFTFFEGRIAGIYIMLNPEKLAYISREGGSPEGQD